MRISIESTDEIADVNGIPARVWRGVTYGGVECLLFVTRVAVPERTGFGPEYRTQDFSEFERELKETPHTELVAGGYQIAGPISLRLIL
jgi:hypothetical protein